MSFKVKNVKKLKKQQGFTLLEIMVVLVILGLLVTMVAPNVLGNKDKANKQKAVSDIVALENALDMYNLDNNFYPSTEQGLEALVKKPSGFPEPKSWRENGYIKRLPNDPWGNPYHMQVPGEYGAVDVFSAGPDGQPGTDQDIGNWDI
ncbi:type II secretion system major pseudopilin GspG [Sansalvadorimonas sp. 2012CJ34-2]|uniref:Type II secretion system core protein G n=1 Tax=Parendozoicomonas callyspongiae TaxID=2942213 RepID=A0ABT0PBY8_9GAMM|nr:type II secretion system major pseudopilin GspG [Sansalvadorimonas sp. 2012CJ34-2]MCL6268741.1 type II secretion system major pseudopilin GspG [Sansalvadorimonas sp. 2012CJ34-2]